MTARNTRRAAWTAALALAFGMLGLTGCVGQGEVQTHFYVLSPLPASTPALAGARERGLAIDIAALRLPQYLQRPQIVTRTSDNRVQLAEYDQWGGNLSKDLMQVLARNLSRLLATPEIAIFSRRPASSSDLRVEIDVLQFERGPAGRILLAAQWRLRNGGDRDAAITRITELGSPALPAEADMEATVSAMSTLWGEFSRIVAEAILKSARVQASRG